MPSFKQKPLLSKFSWQLLLLAVRLTTRVLLAMDWLQKLPIKLRTVTPNTWIALALIVTGVVLRLLPHSANFTPVGAIALFGGAILGKLFALWLPLAIMVISDLFIGLHGTVLFTWSGFMLVGAFGMLLKDKPNQIRIPMGAFGAAVIFYIVSNFGVWLEGKLYAYTWQGLVDCYVAAIPFLRNSLLANFLFMGALFGSYWLAGRVLIGHKTAEMLK